MDNKEKKNKKRDYKKALAGFLAGLMLLGLIVPVILQAMAYAG